VPSDEVLSVDGLAENMGRYAFSIFPRVRLSPWFLNVVADRPIFTVIFRLISNHTRVRAHLSRINNVAEALCGCGCDYETVDHILWSCPLYRHERIQLWSQLSTSNRLICVRDMLALRQWCDIRVCVSFLSSINFHVLLKLSSSWSVCVYVCFMIFGSEVLLCFLLKKKIPLPTFNEKHTD
jgi:hypothetical protein